MEIQANCTKALGSTKDKLYHLHYYYYYFTKSYYVNVQTYICLNSPSPGCRERNTYTSTNAMLTAAWL